MLLRRLVAHLPNLPYQARSAGWGKRRRSENHSEISEARTGAKPQREASAEPFRAPAKALGGSEPEPYLLARGSALLFAARTVSGPARDAFQRDSRRVPPSRCAPAAGRLGPRATLGRPRRTSDDCGAALKRVEAARSPSGVRDIGSAPERPPPPRPRARAPGGERDAGRVARALRGPPRRAARRRCRPPRRRRLRRRRDGTAARGRGSSRAAAAAACGPARRGSPAPRAALRAAPATPASASAHGPAPRGRAGALREAAARLRSSSARPNLAR